MISVVYYIFNQSFVSFNLGYGAALSIVLLGILLVRQHGPALAAPRPGGGAMSARPSARAAASPGT